MGKDELKDLIREVMREVIAEVNLPKKNRMNLDEAVAYLCYNGCEITKSKLYKIGQGIPRDRINGKLSFLRDDLDRFLAKQTAPANSMTEAALNIARAARRKSKIA